MALPALRTDCLAYAAPVLPVQAIDAALLFTARCPAQAAVVGVRLAVAGVSVDVDTGRDRTVGGPPHTSFASDTSLVRVVHLGGGVSTAGRGGDRPVNVIVDVVRSPSGGGLVPIVLAHISDVKVVAHPGAVGHLLDYGLASARLGGATTSGPAPSTSSSASSSTSTAGSRPPLELLARVSAIEVGVPPLAYHNGPLLGHTGAGLEASLRIATLSVGLSTASQTWTTASVSEFFGPFYHAGMPGPVPHLPGVIEAAAGPLCVRGDVSDVSLTVSPRNDAQVDREAASHFPQAVTIFEPADFSFCALACATASSEERDLPVVFVRGPAEPLRLHVFTPVVAFLLHTVEDFVRLLMLAELPGARGRNLAFVQLPGARVSLHVRLDAPEEPSDSSAVVSIAVGEVGICNEIGPGKGTLHMECQPASAETSASVVVNCVSLRASSTAPIHEDLARHVKRWDARTRHLRSILQPSGRTGMESAPAAEEERGELPSTSRTLSIGSRSALDQEETEGPEGEEEEEEPAAAESESGVGPASDVGQDWAMVDQDGSLAEEDLEEAQAVDVDELALDASECTTAPHWLQVVTANMPALVGEHAVPPRIDAVWLRRAAPAPSRPTALHGAGPDGAEPATGAGPPTSMAVEVEVAGVRGSFTEQQMQALQSLPMAPPPPSVLLLPDASVVCRDTVFTLANGESRCGRQPPPIPWTCHSSGRFLVSFASTFTAT